MSIADSKEDLRAKIKDEMLKGNIKGGEDPALIPIMEKGCDDMANQLATAIVAWMVEQGVVDSSAAFALGIGTVMAPTPGGLLSVTISAGGTNYVAGDVLTVGGGGAGGTLTVDTVSATGAVSTVTIASPGAAYVPATAINATGGSGSGCKVNITGINSAGLNTKKIPVIGG